MTISQLLNFVRCQKYLIFTGIFTNIGIIFIHQFTTEIQFTVTIRQLNFKLRVVTPSKVIRQLANEPLSRTLTAQLGMSIELELLLLDMAGKML